MMFQCCSSAAEEARKEIYVQKFLHIAGLLNEQLSTTPLLYGSLGLERRLSADLNADDIDGETGDGSLSPLRLSSAGKSVIIEDG